MILAKRTGNFNLNRHCPYISLVLFATNFLIGGLHDPISLKIRLYDTFDQRILRQKHAESLAALGTWRFYLLKRSNKYPVFSRLCSLSQLKMIHFRYFVSYLAASISCIEQL